MAPGSGSDRYDPRTSRSVQSVWVWRAFLMMALVAGGIAILLATNGYSTYALLWGVIGVGWLAISMWLWRLHSTAEEEDYRRMIAANASPAASSPGASPLAKTTARAKAAGKRKRRR